MLSQPDRKVLIAFLDAHADGDVLVQAANRVANNLEDVQNLKKFIEKLKPLAPVPAPNVGRDNAVDPPPEPAGEPEDLGPACKKLGSNGQAIQKYMEKTGLDLTLDRIVEATKIAKAKVKPMLALMLERDIIESVVNDKYKIK